MTGEIKKTIMKEQRKRNLIDEAVATEVPLEKGGKLKAGDYVAVDATRFKQLLNYKQIVPFVHNAKNKLYVIKLQNGMVKVSNSKWSRKPTIDIPISALRAKIINVEQ